MLLLMNRHLISGVLCENHFVNKKEDYELITLDNIDKCENSNLIPKH